MHYIDDNISMAGRRRKKSIPSGFMARNKAFRFRACPTGDQRVMVRKTSGCCRKVHNLMLDDNIEKFGETGEWETHTPAEYKNEFPYLKEVDSTALTNEQLNLENAYINHAKNPAHFGLPNFKAKHFSKVSYTSSAVKYTVKQKDAEGNEITVEKSTIELCGNYLRLPKLGWLKLRMHRQLPQGAVIKSVTITEESSGAVYVSILVEMIVKEEKDFYGRIDDMAESAKTKKTKPVRVLRAVGLDYSSPHFYVASDGYIADMPHWYRISESRLSMLLSRLSKKVKGSKNYQKLKRKIAKLQEHIRAQRRDWQEKEATRLVSFYDIVCVEDIDYQGMAQSLKLGKSTNDNAFGQFLRILERKLSDKGGILIRIGKWEPTTKLCKCGYVNPDVKLGMDVIVCPVCHRTYDRDRNASDNILNAGLKILHETLRNRGTRGVRLLIARDNYPDQSTGSSLLLDVG